MKVNDLRIGNWIKVNDPIFGVNTYKVATIRDNVIITLNDNMSCLVDNIEPIELTEEVLLKIGFIHRIGMCHFQIIEENKKIEVYYNPPIGGLIAYIDEKDKEFEKIEKFGIRYLHELQNAYYCLTNEELEVEL